jgi:hypothetical protein
MDSLQNIISRYGTPEQPELIAIKKYVSDKYTTLVSTAINGETIIVTVPSAALANTLRLQTTQIQEVCNIQKRLVFRIG